MKCMTLALKGPYEDFVLGPQNRATESGPVGGLYLGLHVWVGLVGGSPALKNMCGKLEPVSSSSSTIGQPCL